MEFVAKHLYATYSANSFSWHVDLEEVVFEVRYIMIDGLDTEGHLGVTIQKIIGEDVECEFLGNILTIKKWKKLEKEKLWDLFNPDKPRNLAKSVTVR